jgi:hypothetical protein
MQVALSRSSGVPLCVAGQQMCENNTLSGDALVDRLAAAYDLS